ncbi:MAG: single-stranded-DNA-specific exonuclease RecJ [Patescibacteria group bacterium]|nr:single-stranded-DNA-specific exonuclease RecJ [Patescibacteria group bacterium]
MPTLFGYNWQILNSDPNLATFEKVLWNRGVNPKDLEDSELLSPWLFPDMKKATERIKKAIRNKERIIVFGDYDADGITGTAILVQAFRELGAEVSYRLPNRETDGYGLHMNFVEEFIKIKAKLIITVDCGISSAKEVKILKEAGIDTIITDHHAIPEKAPKPYAIIHPENYTFKHLSGSGVAYKLAEALLGEEAYKYLDLAAIGTIADIVPLYGENRTIARLGLRQMARTKWSGLRALKKISQVKKEDLRGMESEMVGYRIAPRLNAAGRLYDPYIALQLLISDNGERFAEKLDEINKERQGLVNDIIKNLKYDQKEKIIFLEGDWPQGVSGLISGRITEESYKPSLVMTRKNGLLTGSARSPEYFDITEGLKAASDLLEEYGGHAQAAGFTLKKENLEAFRKRISSAKINMKPRQLKIDCSINPEDLQPKFYKNLNKLKPFGEKNEKPIFLLEDILIKEARNIGAEKNHIRLKGVFGSKMIAAVKFNTGQLDIADLVDKKVSLAASIIKDIYSQTGYGLMIEDIKVA